jgi:hypothetical protein
MSITLRILCILGAAVTFIVIAGRVRKARVRIDDSIFWIVFSLALLVIAIFPDIPIFFARLFGFQATSNFVFLVVITVLLMREFLNTIKISTLNSRLDELVQEQALQAMEEEEDGTQR